MTIANLTRRQQLRIGVIFDKPLCESCALQPDCPRRGLAFDAARMACDLMDADCSFEQYESYDYGHIDETGNVTGLLRAVADGRFDTTLPFITGTYDRFRSVHFSAGYFFIDNVLVTRMPRSKNTDEGDSVRLDWNIVKSFEWPVWLAFVAAYSCTMTLMYAIDRMRRREWARGYRSSVPYDFENRRRRFDRASDRLVYMAFRLLEFIFVCSYAGIMYSNQVVTKETPPFVDLDTFIDCLTQSRCRLIAPSLSYSSYQLLEAQGGERLARALSRSPPIIVEMRSIPDAIIAEPDPDLHLTWIIPRMFYNALTENNRDCRFYEVIVPFADVNTFAVRRSDEGHRLKEMLDRAAGLLHQHGFLASLQSKYRVNVNLCGQFVVDTQFAAPSTMVRVLTVRSIRAALAFYGCAAAASIVLFVVEKMVDRIAEKVARRRFEQEEEEREDETVREAMRTAIVQRRMTRTEFVLSPEPPR